MYTFFLGFKPKIVTESVKYHKFNHSWTNKLTQTGPAGQYYETNTTFFFIYFFIYVKKSKVHQKKKNIN